MYLSVSVIFFLVRVLKSEKNLIYSIKGQTHCFWLSFVVRIYVSQPFVGVNHCWQLKCELNANRLGHTHKKEGNSTYSFGRLLLLLLLYSIFFSQLAAQNWDHVIISTHCSERNKFSYSVPYTPIFFCSFTSLKSQCEHELMSLNS